MRSKTILAILFSMPPILLSGQGKITGNIIPLKAQTADTCRILSDSIPQTVNRESVFKGKELWEIAIPAAMITYGIISIESDWLKQLDYSTRDKLLESNSLWYNSWDNYVQFLPAAAAFGMKLCGVESKHQLSDMLILYTLSNALEGGIVVTAKNRWCSKKYAELKC